MFFTHKKSQHTLIALTVGSALCTLHSANAAENYRTVQNDEPQTVTIPDERTSSSDEEMPSHLIRAHVSASMADYPKFVFKVTLDPTFLGFKQQLTSAPGALFNFSTLNPLQISPSLLLKATEHLQFHFNFID